MLMGVVGGKLQGLEIVYLAKKAGHRILLMDRNPNVAARELCDRFMEVDVADVKKAASIMETCDLIFPAFEDLDGLITLNQICRKINKPFAFDLDAYRISSSKLDSDQLFADFRMPQPKRWPDCQFPVVAKPSEGSGSKDIQVFNTLEDANLFFSSRFPPKHWVVQEYIEGPLYSIEVIGKPGCYLPLQITRIWLDEFYDCKRVTAPATLSNKLKRQFNTLAIDLATAIQLKGIMDVEVISHNGQLKLLEIDARFPSQTPIAVFWSSGLNMVDILAKLFFHEERNIMVEPTTHRHVSLEHISVSGDMLCVRGEHIMGNGGGLCLKKNSWGSDEALTNFEENQNSWVATLIITGETEDIVSRNRAGIINTIQEQTGITTVSDLFPPKLNEPMP